MSLLSLLPDDLLCLVVHFAMAAGPPLLGLRRTYGIVGTRIVVCDEKAYRQDNTPPTPVVKRALMAIWSSGLAADGRVQFRMVTMGPPHVVRYNCDLRGFAEGGPPPTELAHLNIAAADR
eukprot:jgi/Tetstr1/461902/TSEL_006980.t1